MLKILLKPKISKEMKYTKKLFYIKHLEIFATDIYAHKNFIKRSIKKYIDDVQEFLQTFDDAEKEEAKASEVQVAIDELCSSLDL